MIISPILSRHYLFKKVSFVVFSLLKTIIESLATKEMHLARKENNELFYIIKQTITFKKRTTSPPRVSHTPFFPTIGKAQGL
jgi:hypothetical protein